MEILEVYGYSEARKKLSEGTDIVVFNQQVAHDFMYYGGFGGVASRQMRCHVMTFSNELASKITDEFGWEEVNRHRSRGYITLLSLKGMREVISTLGALEV